MKFIRRTRNSLIIDFYRINAFLKKHIYSNKTEIEKAYLGQY